MTYVTCDPRRGGFGGGINDGLALASKGPIIRSGFQVAIAIDGDFVANFVVDLISLLPFVDGVEMGELELLLCVGPSCGC